MEINYERYVEWHAVDNDVPLTASYMGFTESMGRWDYSFEDAVRDLLTTR